MRLRWAVGRNRSQGCWARPGWLGAALAGRRDLFADVATGAVTHAGTFNGNTVATAAVLASLDELASGEVYERVSQVGTALMQSIRSCAAARVGRTATPAVTAYRRVELT